MTRSEIKKEAKTSLKGNLGFSIVVLLIFIGISFVISLISSLFQMNLLLFCIISIVSYLISILTSVCVSDYFLSVVNYCNSNRINELFRKANRCGDAFLAYLLILLINVGVSIIPVGIMLNVALPVIKTWDFTAGIGIEQLTELSIVLGIWPNILEIILAIVTIKFTFVPYLLCSDAKLGGLEAIKVSWRLTKGNFWRIVVFELSFIGWILLVGITFGIAAFYVFPYMYTANANLYKTICNEKGAHYAIY